MGTLKANSALFITRGSAYTLSPFISGGSLIIRKVRFGSIGLKIQNSKKERKKEKEKKKTLPCQIKYKPLVRNSKIVSDISRSTSYICYTIDLVPLEEKPDLSYYLGILSCITKLIYSLIPSTTPPHDDPL